MGEVPPRLPAYRELPITPGAPPGSAWGVFGDDDELGTINLLTPERVARAAQLVRTGAVFSLNWRLAATEDMLEFLWDLHAAAVAADCASLEAWPHASTEDGFLHLKIIPLLGMAVGDLFVLDELAAACAADGAFDCFVTAAPLNKAGGIGSPANAIAIK